MAEVVSWNDIRSFAIGLLSRIETAYLEYLVDLDLADLYAFLLKRISCFAAMLLRALVGIRNHAFDCDWTKFVQTTSGSAMRL